MPKLVLVGGGHAHMTMMSRIADFRARGHEVAVVSPVRFHSYSGMAPGMLGGTYTPQDIRFSVPDMVLPRGGELVRGAVVRVHAEERQLELADGSRIGYDVASFNVGSGVTGLDTTQAGDSYLPVKPVGNLLVARNQIRQLARTGGSVVVVGSGPAAVEVAGNAQAAAAQFKERFGQRVSVTVLAGKGLLRRFPEKVRRMAYASLERRGVEIRPGGYAKSVHNGQVVLQDGQRVSGDLILGATGVQPPMLFADSGLPTGPDNGLNVNQYLQCPAHPQLFGGGDCIHFAPQPLAKVGVYAVRQNPVLADNLLAALENKPLRAFDPGGGYLLILNLGGGRAILRKGPLVFDGALAMAVKSYIDKAFMRRFQPQ